MLAGAGGIDLALLVVAADDGIMPQTREHLAILDLLGLSRGLVALTKADLADADRRAEVTAQIRDALADSGLADAPIIPVSSLTGEGVDSLRDALIAAEAQVANRTADAGFRLAVDRSFTLQGAGTVVTGTVLSGQVAVGDLVTISPSGIAARVRGIHAQNRQATHGLAGQRCALTLAGEAVAKDAIHRGDIVLAPGAACADRTDRRRPDRAGHGDRSPSARGFPPARTATRPNWARGSCPLGDPIAPGRSGPVQIVLDRPIALRPSATGSSCATCPPAGPSGGGHFLDLRPPARKRRTPERLALIEAAQAPDPLQAMMAVGPVDSSVIVRDRALSPADAAAALSRARIVAGLALSPAHLDALQRGIIDALSAFHAENPDLPGMGRERLRLALTPRLPKDAYLALLRGEADAGRIVPDGAFLRLPGHEVRLSVEDEALGARILPSLTGDLRYRPPRVRDFATDFGVDEKEVRRVLRMTQKLGRTDQIAHDHFFARAVTADMVTILRDVAAATPDGWFTAPLFRDRVQNGRKVAIEILDFFDRHGVTLRRGDLRRLNPHRLDLFG